jgi:hypothetical protein
MIFSAGYEIRTRLNVFLEKHSCVFTKAFKGKGRSPSNGRLCASPSVIQP